jgi:hypothetical protein
MYGSLNLSSMYFHVLHFPGFVSPAVDALGLPLELV